MRVLPPLPRYFTLLEVLISILLLAGLLALVFAGSQMVMQAWARTEARSRQFEEVLTLDRTLDNLLSNVVAFTWPNEDRVEQLQFTGARDVVRFAYLHPCYRPADGGLRFCYLAREGDTLAAYYAERPPVPADPRGSTGRRSILARHVTDVSFSYADFDESGAPVLVTDWDAEERPYLPLAIMVRVTWDDGTQNAWLRRTAANGFAETWAGARQRNPARTESTTRPRPKRPEAE